ncbi:MAG: DUF4358 domain-containing protein [Clostridia bacterium]|nr:DUF4358 domain-containing protein [Clostridia bacterium]
MKRMITLLMALLTVFSLAACGGKEEAPAKDYSAQEIFDAIKDAYGENFIPDADMVEEEYTETYGLNMDDVAEIKAQMAMISFHPDRIVVIKAKEGKGEAVEAALTAARENLVQFGMWYPANLAKVNASQVLRNGDYVVFMMLGAADDNIEATEEEAAKFAKEQMQIGVDAFNKLFK